VLASPGDLPLVAPKHAEFVGGSETRFRAAEEDGAAALAVYQRLRTAAFPRMRINSVDPGFTSTDFNQHRETQTVEEGAEVIVRYALVPVDGPSGGFFDREGTEPW
jgi:hypothetical protein